MGSGYLDHLIVERKYAQAASLCPKLLRGSASAWERYYLPLFINLWTICLKLVVGCFPQMGFPLCSSPSASCVGPIHANRKPKTAWYCLWGLLDKILHLNILKYLFIFVLMWTLRIQGLLLPFVLQVALVALATNPSFHEDLLSTVKSWPHVMYSALPVISAIEPQLNTSSMTDALKEVRQTKMHTFTYF